MSKVSEKDPLNKKESRYQCESGFLFMSKGPGILNQTDSPTIKGPSNSSPV